MKVSVCSWDAEHTLEIVEAQERAIASGEMRRVALEHSSDEDAMRAALLSQGLLTSYLKAGQYPVCARCHSLMDVVLSRDGIESRVEAVRDVTQDVDKAIARTREAKATGRF